MTGLFKCNLAGSSCFKALETESKDDELREKLIRARQRCVFVPGLVNLTYLEEFWIDNH